MRTRYGQTMRFLVLASLGLSMLFIISGVASMISRQLYIGIIDLVIGIFSLVYFVIFRYNRKTVISEYVRLLGTDNNPVSSNIMSSFPIPMVVTHIDGSVRW